MRELGAKPERIIAVIGPAISQEPMRSAPTIVERFLAEEPASAAFFRHRRGLRRAPFRPRRPMSASGWRGPASARIAELGLCTYCEEMQAVQLSPVAASRRGRLRPSNFRHPAHLSALTIASKGRKAESTLKLDASGPRQVSYCSVEGWSSVTTGLSRAVLCGQQRERFVGRGLTHVRGWLRRIASMALAAFAHCSASRAAAAVRARSSGASSAARPACSAARPRSRSPRSSAPPASRRAVDQALVAAGKDRNLTILPEGGRANYTLARLPARHRARRVARRSPISGT